MEDRFDLAIIGAGEAGQAAAYLAPERGASVAVVDRELFGGSCPFWACMPSKALLHAAAIHAHTRAVRSPATSPSSPRQPRTGRHPLIAAARRRSAAWRPGAAGQPVASYRAPLRSRCVTAMCCQRILAGCRRIGATTCREAPALAAASARLA